LAAQTPLDYQITHPAGDWRNVDHYTDIANRFSRKYGNEEP